MIDFLNSVIVLLNFIIIPGITYGSQLAIGALGVTFVYAILRFAILLMEKLCHLAP